MTSIMVFAVFLVCYLPLVILRTIAIQNKFINNYVTPCFATLLFTSFTINAIIYGLRNDDLGKAMKNQLKRTFCIATPSKKVSMAWVPNTNDNCHTEE